MKLLSLLTLLCVVFLLSCSQSPDSPRGFSLPEGDTAKGEILFKHFQCLSCHSLKGVEQPYLEKTLEKPIPLGGQVSRVKTYAELVTAIINPSHEIAVGFQHSECVVNGRSKMTNYNDVMTVSELTDLVTYLQRHYEVKPQQYTRYNVYHIP